MLATYLLRVIERHSEALADALVRDLTTNERTPSYRRLQPETLRERTNSIYHHVVDWLGNGTEVQIASTFEALGRQRFAPGHSPRTEIGWQYFAITSRKRL